ncbi:WbqC family protein [Tunicatimonas pelagia]|uniref:WbqC family protein n=1 Tax=Tunicatimonas pelagia TaxID=931531 RepID=UPI002666EF86|nr:WbqC family protein [Tunicatimonas pelagia]WKN45143.1 WbqC family protein [Tunicatimonas pelagia]
MQIAVMQPYIFPYLGYYQLVASADRFIFFNDVNFIKKGWIHRNTIAVQQKPYRFTVPLQQASQNKAILDTLLHPVEYPRWRKKFLTTLNQSYQESPFFNETYALVSEVLYASVDSIADLAANSIITVTKHLGLNLGFTYSSDLPYHRDGDGQDKILSICQLQQASAYVNPIGGKELYEHEAFQQNNLQLSFLQSLDITYSQSAPTFIANLSIIDVLMHCSVPEIKKLLLQYKLITKTPTYESSQL